MPFMLAEKYAKPWSYMTAYNKLNGTHVSENPFIIKDVLRKEWGSDAMVMSDWFGVYSVAESINAGLDLEMPGTNKWRTWDKVNRTVASRKTTARIVKERAAKVLELVKKCAQGAPDVCDFLLHPAERCLIKTNNIYDRSLMATARNAHKKVKKIPLFFVRLPPSL